MPVVAPGRVVALVSVLLFLRISTVFAHALPGSTLVFSRTAQQLMLSITVPIEELLIADSSLGALSGISPNASIPLSVASQVESYFSRHVVLQKGGVALPLAIMTMSIDAASHEDVGAYTVLNLMLVTQRGLEVAPLMLRYDAVMHEVRTHKATVYWSDGVPAAERSIPLNRFGFKRVDGEQQMLKLRFPEGEIAEPK